MSERLWRGALVFCGLMLLWGLASRSGIPHFLYLPRRRSPRRCGSIAPISAGTR